MGKQEKKKKVVIRTAIIAAIFAIAGISYIAFMFHTRKIDRRKYDAALNETSARIAEGVSEKSGLDYEYSEKIVKSILLTEYGKADTVSGADVQYIRSYGSQDDRLICYLFLGGGYYYEAAVSDGTLLYLKAADQEIVFSPGTRHIQFRVTGRGGDRLLVLEEYEKEKFVSMYGMSAEYIMMAAVVIICAVYFACAVHSRFRQIESEG